MGLDSFAVTDGTMRLSQCPCVGTGSVPTPLPTRAPFAFHIFVRSLNLIYFPDTKYLLLRCWPAGAPSPRRPVRLSVRCGGHVSYVLVLSLGLTPGASVGHWVLGTGQGLGSLQKAHTVISVFSTTCWPHWPWGIQSSGPGHFSVPLQNLLGTCCTQVPLDAPCLAPTWPASHLSVRVLCRQLAPEGQTHSLASPSGIGQTALVTESAPKGYQRSSGASPCSPGQLYVIKRCPIPFFFFSCLCIVIKYIKFTILIIFRCITHCH